MIGYASILAESEIARLAAMRRARQAYAGIYPDPLTVNAKAGLLAADNVKLNYARLIVDKAAALLFNRPPSFDVDDAPGERSRPERYLDRVWHDAAPATLLKLAINGSITGTAYIMVEEGPIPRLSVIHPEYVTITTDPLDIDRVERFIIEWPDVEVGQTIVETLNRRTIQRSGRGWEIIDQRSAQGGAWDTVAVAQWRYSWAPLHWCQNLPAPNEIYGESDIPADTLDAIQAINYIISNLARITRHHAHPKTWGRGFKASDVRLAVNEIMVLPSEHGELKNLEAFGNLAYSHRTWEMLLDALHELAYMPSVAAGKLDAIGQLSGTALEILYGPVIERTQTKRSCYGPMLGALNEHLLELGEFSADTTVTVTWEPIQPTSRSEQLAELAGERELGVSRDTVLTKLGYDPAAETAKRAAEDAAAEVTAQEASQ